MQITYINLFIILEIYQNVQLLQDYLHMKKKKLHFIMNSELCNFLTCQYSSSSFNSTEHLKINTVVAMKLAAQEPLGKWYAEVV